MEGRKTFGVGLIVIGIVLVFLMLLADQIGIGSPEHGIGRLQKPGAAFGTAVAIGEAVLNFRK
jgi:hypothetical protein